MTNEVETLSDRTKWEAAVRDRAKTYDAELHLAGDESQAYAALHFPGGACREIGIWSDDAGTLRFP